MRLNMAFKWLKRTFLLTLGLVAVVLVVVATWHWQETRKTARMYPPPGVFIDLGTHRLHCDVEGSGTPIVVMDNGILGASWGFESIQDEVATLTTVCTFDRAGHAWSDSGPKPRNPKTIVGELRAMLKKAKLDPPYVLVGASLGGWHMRYFASTHSDEVAA